MVNFALTPGMKNNALIEELRGKVSGEFRQQVPLYSHNEFPQHGCNLIESPMFVQPLDYKEKTPCTNAANHIKSWEHNWLSEKCVTREVIAVDRANNYAIIQHSRYQTSVCDACHRARVSLLCLNPDEIDYIPSYFLCGINNDDGLYFLHPLFRVPEELIGRTKNHGDVMSIVKWCNKEDWGFEGRIQGDVIIAEVEPRVSKMIARKDYIDEIVYDFLAGKNKMCISVKIHRKEKFKAGNWPHDLKHLMDYMKNHFPQQHIMIGDRHELSTDGYIVTEVLWPSEGNMWLTTDFNTFVVLGSELIIYHPEHPTVKKQISADKALLVSIQRGFIRDRIDD